MGRWISRDPIGLEGGVNVYAYCAGNPVMSADPSGLDAVILYGPDWKSENKFFRDLAYSHAGDHVRYHGASGSKARVFFVKNFDDIQRALSETRNIDTIIYVGHAGVPGNKTPSDAFLFLQSPGLVGSADVSATEISKLSRKNVLPNCVVLLEGCGTATRRNQPHPLKTTGSPIPEGKISLAQAWADQFQVPTYGFVQHVSFGRMSPVFMVNPVGFDYGGALGRRYYHNYDIEIFPVLVQPRSRFFYGRPG